MRVAAAIDGAALAKSRRESTKIAVLNIFSLQAAAERAK
jgi:hypothetical protein